MTDFLAYVRTVPAYELDALIESWSSDEPLPASVRTNREEAMPSYKQAFPSKWLKAEDLNGRAARVRIESVAEEDIEYDGKAESKLVARFKGKDKGLILNVTNCESIANIIETDNYDDWVGHEVVLFCDTTRFGGKKVPCIRIQAPPNGGKPAPAPVPVKFPESDEEVDSDIPF